MKKLIIATLLILIGIILWQAYKPTDKDAGKTVSRTTTTQIVDIIQKVEATGITAPILQTDVKSEINGRVERILTTAGHTVKQDQELIYLDTRTIEAELEEAKRRHEAQALRLAKARRDFERLEKLSEKNYARESEYLDAKTNLQLAQLDLDIQAARLESAYDKRDKAIIKAPHDGTVLNLDINEGQVITGANSFSNGTTLLQIADITRLKIEIDLNEVDINKVNLGDKATLAFDALEDETFTGTITEISPNAVSKNNARTFPITISIDDTDPRIKPGISASIDLPIAEAHQVVGVSLSAVFISDDYDRKQPERMVYQVNNDGSYKQRIVTTGISDNQFIEITSGIEAGVKLSLIRPTTFKQ